MDAKKFLPALLTKYYNGFSIYYILFIIIKLWETFVFIKLNVYIMMFAHRLYFLSFYLQLF